MDIQVHGAMVEVLGVGVLLRGASGVGKSETALELVQRGFKLIADDVVRVSRGETAEGRAIVQGRAPDLIRHYMEIRGIGLLYIPDLYGEDAVRLEAEIQLICHLEQWREGMEYERIGLERARDELAGVSLPLLVLPVRPARSIATLIEVGVRDLLMRRHKPSAAERLDARLIGSSR